MRSTVLTPLGVEIADVDLRRADAALVRDLGRLLAEHGVAVLPHQELDDAEFLAFLLAFGPLMTTVGETPLPGYPDLNVISNVGRSTPPRSQWHVDTSYVSVPPAYTALRAVTIPSEGGETLFSDQYAAYETLPSDLRDRLHGKRIRHVVSGVDPGDAQESEAWHPVFREHPMTGRTSLYLSTPQRCVEVEGLDPDESREVVERLYAHSSDESRVLRHPWSPGEVVMWDNGCVMHKADHSGVVGDRVMHRGMVATYGAPGAAA